MKKNVQDNVFVCKECGFESIKWVGRCPQCNSWNSLVEFKPSKYKLNITKFSSDVKNLDDIEVLNANLRVKIGISEFDRIMGGGVVIGSVTLIGGEPGVGKSTLMLQIANKISSIKKTDQETYKILYITGEESIEQIKLRSLRLNINNSKIYVLSETLLENILSTIDSLGPDFIIIDSIQTVFSEQLPGIQGSVQQIRGVTSELIRLAKFRNITVFILGHITKEGEIAGPKLLEHMVDTVLYFETEILQNYRILRVYKNRFGTSSEIGIFEMKENGLISVENPSEIFVHHQDNLVGTITSCIMEGTRTILTQVQSLLTKSYFPQPRRVVSGLDYNRTMLLISVLEKFVGVNLMYEDIYLSIVAGLKAKETAIDLAVAASIYSSHKNITVDTKTVYIGEIGLNGEVRAISFINERINEIAKLGYKKIVLPQENRKVINMQNNKIDLEFISKIEQLEKIL
ncbi:MAG: DNA repair protein RadA [Endomicrobia bacterium]|nr:DNA repair protein RadA [Endomicrobiia bacterium]